MPKYLLDTNGCIALRYHLKGNASKDAARRASDERLITRWKSMAATELAMSLFTLGELRVFVEKHDDPGVRRRAEQLLDRLCQQVSVLEQPGHDAAQGGSRALAHHYAAIRASLEKQGRGIGPNDTWIAAHARVHGLTVVTQNTSEFSRVPGLAVEDWTA